MALICCNINTILYTTNDILNATVYHFNLDSHAQNVYKTRAENPLYAFTMNGVFVHFVKPRP